MALACGQIFANLWAFGFFASLPVRFAICLRSFPLRHGMMIRIRRKGGAYAHSEYLGAKARFDGKRRVFGGMVRCELSAGHAAAVVAGVDASDEPTLPEGAEPYFVRFNTEALPFNVCGMSDVMPYFGRKSIGPPPQPVSITQSYCRYSCGVSGSSRMRWLFVSAMHSHTKTSACRVIASVCIPRALH